MNPVAVQAGFATATCGFHVSPWVVGNDTVHTSPSGRSRVALVKIAAKRQNWTKV